MSMKHIDLVYVGPIHYELNKSRLEKILREFSTFKIRNIESIHPEIKTASLGFVPDNFFFSELQPLTDGEFVVYISRSVLEENWFVRRNDREHKGENKNPTALVVTTHETYDIARDADVSFEKLLAGLIVVSIMTSYFLARGGTYENLYSEEHDGSVFSFCANKPDIVQGFKNPKTGPRAQAALLSVGLSESMLECFSKDLKLLEESFFEKLCRHIKYHPFLWGVASNLVTGAIFYWLGRHH